MKSVKENISEEKFWRNLKKENIYPKKKYLLAVNSNN